MKTRFALSPYTVNSIVIIDLGNMKKENGKFPWKCCDTEI